MEKGSKGSWDFQGMGWLGKAMREVASEFHEGPGEHQQLRSIHHSDTWHFSERQQIIVHASSHKEEVTHSGQECLRLQSYHSTVLFRVRLEISTPTLPQDTQKSSVWQHSSEAPVLQQHELQRTVAGPTDVGDLNGH